MRLGCATEGLKFGTFIIRHYNVSHQRGYERGRLGRGRTCAELILRRIRAVIQLQRHSADRRDGERERRHVRQQARTGGGGRPCRARRRGAPFKEHLLHRAARGTRGRRRKGQRDGGVVPRDELQPRGRRRRAVGRPVDGRYARVDLRDGEIDFGIVGPA